MNYKARVLALLVAATATSAAMASDGTINFNGELKAETCKVAVNGAGASGTVVTLPTLSTSVLATAGQVAGQTGFNIQLSDCSAALKTASAFFEAGGTVDPKNGNLRSSGSATNVQLQLVDATNGEAIKAGDTGQVASTSRIDIDEASLTADLPYAVQYFAEAATGPGTVISNVTYSINYQ
ncbi:fimbrial protein [Pseudomonas mucidolens]|uniref:Major type 1 subunit fimbrin (Pilin) n=1 Tax=Pseudomonas mucidolens TaxID=46679 RepID=A0A1H2NA33_9PSED|nr:fimbrial protein [Pseudomonas mucidolens]SDV01945.1 major type 1 subunit fimbrin (pilin) [Pseudomonas mucidolens]SQH32400.1 fimbrial subunit protein [Pseudomonas mucidolens]